MFANKVNCNCGKIIAYFVGWRRFIKRLTIENKYAKKSYDIKVVFKRYRDFYFA